MNKFYDKFVKELITAKRVSPVIPENYSFAHLRYPDICIPNRGLAWTIYFKAEDSEEKTRIKKDIESYNAYLDRLDSIDGFRHYFISHDLRVSKSEIAERWSEETAEAVFTKGKYIFTTNLKIIGDYLVDVSLPVTFSAQINGAELSLPIGQDATKYPETVGDRRLIWNWVDNGHDFCLSLWELLGSPYRENEDSEDDDAVSYSFDAYDQFRDEDPEEQLVRIFTKLLDLGYIKLFAITPENEEPLWNYYCQSDGSIDCAIVDMSFLKNKLLMEQIKLLLWAKPDELQAKPYIITDDNNNQTLSSVPGTLGGHKKLKIYGRLDCPSAKRHLEKGQYAKNRVFFLSEAIARSAGYRPCAICMPEEYKKWKAEKEEEEFWDNLNSGFEQGFYQ